MVSPRGVTAGWAWGAMVVATLSATQPSTARASCAQLAPVLLWSYPEDGTDQVPTNAQPWVVTNYWGGPTEATLNGEPIEAIGTGTFSAFRFEPGDLEPDTAYVLELVFPGDGTADVTLSVQFTTGDGPGADAPDAPVVQSTRRDMGWPDGHACEDVIAAQDCFDTGQDTLLTFDVTAQPEAVAWLVTNEYAGASTLWPASCGNPAVYGGGEGCFDLRAVGPGGALGEATSLCVPAPPVTGNPGALVDAGAPDTGAGNADAGGIDPGPPVTGNPGAFVDAGGDALEAVDAGEVPSASDDDGGCGCRAPGAHGPRPKGLASIALAPVLIVLRRRRRAAARR